MPNILFNNPSEYFITLIGFHFIPSTQLRLIHDISIDDDDDIAEILKILKEVSLFKVAKCHQMLPLKRIWI